MDSWPPELDGVEAAPHHHHVLFENKQVRVIETVVAAGETTPVHTHPKTLMYIVSGSHFVRTAENGEVLFDSRDQDPPFVMPPVLWSEGTPPHTIENPATEDLIVIGVELKR